MAGGCFSPCGDLEPCQLPSPWPVATVPPGSAVPAPPLLRGLSRGYAVVGGDDFRLFVYGQNFTQGSVIVWNAGVEPTQFDGSTMLSTIVKPGTATIGTSVPVLVRNPDGQETEAATFTFVEMTPLITPSVEAA